MTATVVIANGLFWVGEAITTLGAYYIGSVTLTSPFHRFGGTVVFMAAVVLLAALGWMLPRMAGTPRR